MHRGVGAKELQKERGEDAADGNFFHKPTSTTALVLLFVVVSNTADTVTRQELFDTIH